MYDTFFKERMIFCRQRTFCELVAHQQNDQPNKAKTNTKRQHQVGCMEHALLGSGDLVNAREYHLEETQPVTEDQ